MTLTRPKTAAAVTFCLWLVTSTASAQQEPEQSKQPRPEPMVTRVLHVNNIPAEEAAKVLSSFAAIRSSGPLKVITATGTEEQLHQLEQALEDIDQPPSNGRDANVLLTVYSIGVNESSSTGNIPSNLTSVVDELRKHFPYENYSLLETFAIRASLRNPAELEGIMPGSTGPLPAIYGFDATIDAVTGQKGQEAITFSDIRAYWRLPINSNNYTNLQIKTKLTIPASKLVVLGKAGAAGVSDGLFVVLRADVVQ